MGRISQPHTGGSARVKSPKPRRKAPSILASDQGSAVDELSQIRMAIRALRARETALVEQILEEAGPGDHEGSDVTLTIHTADHRMIDESRLPPEIRNDANYWIMEQRNRLRVRPHGEPVPISEAAIVLKGDIVAVARRSSTDAEPEQS